MPIDFISKMFGHTNVRMTQVYAIAMHDKPFEEADKFIEAAIVEILHTQKALKPIVWIKWQFIYTISTRRADYYVRQNITKYVFCYTQLRLQ